MPTHASALAVGHQLHEYRIDRLLGHGGFGLTYLAEDTNLNALVAIKEFLPQEFAVRGVNSTVFPKSDGDTEPYRWGLERFKDEARALARFKHPNIVRASRLIEANGTAYMVMDFEPGISLAQYLKRVSSTLNEAQILGIFFSVLDGLEALHAVELVHRDIKPGNIYLRAEGAPMLIDFGAVRHAIGVHSRSLTSMVTAGYAPIEQYSSEGRQGPWSDLYAMGATLYNCMFGRVPVDAARRSAAISEGGDDPYALATKMDHVNTEFSTPLLECVDWMLQYRIRDRPQSAAVLRERLQTSPVKPMAVKVPAEALEATSAQAFGAPSDHRGSNQSASDAPQPVIPDSAVLLHARSGKPDAPAPYDPNQTDIRQPTEIPMASAAKPGVPEVQSVRSETIEKPAPFDPNQTDIRQPTEIPVVPAAKQNAAGIQSVRSETAERPAAFDPDKTDIRQPAEISPAPAAASSDAMPEPFSGEKIDISGGVDFEIFEEPPASQASKAVPEVSERSPILEKMGRGIRSVKKPGVTPTPKSRRAEATAVAASAENMRTPGRRKVLLALTIAVVLIIAGVVFWLVNGMLQSDRQLIETAQGSNTVAAYETYLSSCHLCSDRADAAATLQALQAAAQITQLKTQFETLYTAKIYTPPSKPNATDTLLDLAKLDQNDPYVAQARTKLESAIKDAERPSRTNPVVHAVPSQKTHAETARPVLSKSEPRPITKAVNRSSGTLAPNKRQSLSGNDKQGLSAQQQSTGNSPVLSGGYRQAPAAQATTSTTGISTPATDQGSTGSVVPVTQEPRAVYTPAPGYPREAYLDHTQGWVDVEFTIDVDGSVSDVTVVDSHPHIVFDKAARHGVTAWRFTPYTVNGVAQPKRMKLRINFKP
ncbi:MAG: TonB family protein [Gammaproteobacteria bacterium]